MNESNWVDFLILYEIKSRELDSISLIRRELESRGYSVEYLCFAELHCNYQRYISFRDRVGTVMMSSLYHTEETLSIAKFVAGTARFVINLQWEQVLTISAESDLYGYSYQKGIALQDLELHTLHCSRGYELGYMRC